VPIMTDRYVRDCRRHDAGRLTFPLICMDACTDVIVLICFIAVVSDRLHAHIILVPACCLAVVTGCTATRDRPAASFASVVSALPTAPRPYDDCQTSAAGAKSAGNPPCRPGTREAATSADAPSEPEFAMTVVSDSAALEQDDSAGGPRDNAVSMTWSNMDYAPPRSSPTWTIEQLQQLALQHNPSIQQAAAAASRSDGIHVQTGLRPNPTLGYFGEEIGNEGEAGQHGVFVSQTFVRGDKLEWNRQVVGHDVQARRWDVKAQRRRVLTDIRIHFYQALAAQRRRQLTEEFRDVAEESVRITEQGFRSQFNSKADVLQSKIQLSESELAIRMAELDFNASWMKLVAVAGVPDLKLGHLDGDLNATPTVPDADAILDEIISTSPLMAAALSRVNRARASLRRQQMQAVPNITAQLGAGHDDSSGDEFVNIQFSVPVPLHNRNEGNRHAAWAEYCEATQNVRRIRMQIRSDLAGVIRDYESAQASVAQYEGTILPGSSQTLDLMEQAQDAGEYSFFRVFTARRAYFDANISYVSALQNLAVAHAKIEGLLLTGGLSDGTGEMIGTGLREQALSQQ